MVPMRHALIVTFLLTQFAFGQKEISIKTIDNVKRSIVPVVCGYNNKEGKFIVVEVVGSAFFVDSLGRFVTAGHVLDDWDKISKTKHGCSPAFYIPEHAWGRYEKKIGMQVFPFTKCARDFGIDVAICVPNDNPFTSHRINRANIDLLAFDFNEWPDGTLVAFSGFPLESTSPITAKGYIAGKRELETSDKFFTLIIDRASWNGASGSPVYLSNGKVIGVIKIGGGLAYAVGAAAISDFLAKHPPTKSNENEQRH